MEITQNTILKLIVRQGTDGDRQQIILTSGEPGYATDTKRLFIGDGIALGGKLIGNLFKGFTAGNLAGLVPAEVGDYAFDTNNNQFFVYVGPNPSDWTQVAGIYTGSSYISVDPLTNQITILPLSAGAFDPDALGYGLEIDTDSRIAATHSNFTFSSPELTTIVDGNDVSGQAISPLSGDIFIGIGSIGPSFNLSAVSFPLSVVNGKITVPTRTVAISSGLAGYIDDVNVTNTFFNPLTSNLIIKVGELSAGMISSDATSQGITITNGRLALSSVVNFQRVSNTTITVSSGLQSVINGVLSTSPVIVNSLSSNITLMSNDILARYDGLSGQTLVYSRNLLSVIRLSAGDYIFRYNAPTSNVYPIVNIYSVYNFEMVARPIFFDLSACRVLVLSSNNFALRDANLIFRLTY